MNVQRNSHLHQDWKDEGNTCRSLRLGNSIVESSETHSNHERLEKGRNYTCSRCHQDDASDASKISDDEDSTTTLDSVLDAQLIDLFNSNMKDDDFDGFTTELQAHELNILLGCVKHTK